MRREIDTTYEKDKNRAHLNKDTKETIEQLAALGIELRPFAFISEDHAATTPLSQIKTYRYSKKTATIGGAGTLKSPRNSLQKSKTPRRNLAKNKRIGMLAQPPR